MTRSRHLSGPRLRCRTQERLTGQHLIFRLMNGAYFSSRVRSQEGRTRKANARKTWKSELKPLLTNVVENAGLLLGGDFDLLLQLLLILRLQPLKVPLLHLLYSSITSSKGSFCKLKTFIQRFQQPARMSLHSATLQCLLILLS